MTLSYLHVMVFWVVAVPLIILLIFKIFDKKNTYKTFNFACSIVLVFVFVVGIMFLKDGSIYRYATIDFENTDNTYNLVYEVSRIEDTDNVKVMYLDNQFNIHETEVSLRDSIIGTTVCTLGLDGEYDTYLDIGPIRIERKQRRDLLVLSKYWAIQLGLIEAEGNPDEVPFNFTGLDEVLEATPSEVKE